eukprot:983549-Amphidinium_carterae.1
MSSKGKGGKSKSKPTWFGGKSGHGAYRGKGYVPKGETPTGKTSRSGGKQSRLQQIMARAKCNKCRQIGHWQRECPLNRPGAPCDTSSGIAPRAMASLSIYQVNDEKSKQQQKFVGFNALVNDVYEVSAEDQNIVLQKSN